MPTSLQYIIIKSDYAIGYLSVETKQLSPIPPPTIGQSICRMDGNINAELNLVVGKINHVLPNFIPPTFNTCM